MLQYIALICNSYIDNAYSFDWLNQVRHLSEIPGGRGTDDLQKKFTDSVNGKSGLNYWTALESEVSHDKLAKRCWS